VGSNPTPSADVRKWRVTTGKLLFSPGRAIIHMGSCASLVPLEFAPMPRTQSAAQTQLVDKLNGMLPEDNPLAAGGPGLV
jgi:hypothetical protein